MLIPSTKLRKFIAYLDKEAAKVSEKQKEAHNTEDSILAARYYGESLGIIWAATELEKLITEKA